MNEPIQSNGEAVQQILIVLDAKGGLRVQHPQNKIVALGMLAAAQAVILGAVSSQTPGPSVIPVSHFIPRKP